MTDDVKEKPRYGSLKSAIERGDKQKVEELLKAGADFNETDMAGQDMLTYAGNRGKTQIVEMLINYGADVNRRDRNGMTALMGATYRGQINVVRLLIEKGADIDAKDTGGWTAVIWAVIGYKMGALAVLIEKEADVTLRTNNDFDALHFAENKKYIEMARLLRETAELQRHAKILKTARDASSTNQETIMANKKTNHPIKRRIQPQA